MNRCRRWRLLTSSSPLLFWHKSVSSAEFFNAARETLMTSFRSLSKMPLSWLKSSIDESLLQKKICCFFLSAAKETGSIYFYTSLRSREQKYGAHCFLFFSVWGVCCEFWILSSIKEWIKDLSRSGFWPRSGSKSCGSESLPIPSRYPINIKKGNIL